MWRYLGFRLLLFPLTLLLILLVNFVILNLAPGDPAEMIDGGRSGEAGREASTKENILDDPYFQFREHFGLTLPILFNNWPAISEQKISSALTQIELEKSSSERHSALLRWGDRARYLMPKLFSIAANERLPLSIRRNALNLFVRGGLRSSHFGPSISEKAKQENLAIESSNRFFLALHVAKDEKEAVISEKLAQARTWMEEHPDTFAPLSWERRVAVFIKESRFYRYFSRLITLDFGTLRSDPNRAVTQEVIARLKYSITLAIIPMVISFALAQLFGMVMAYHRNRWIDASLNTFFLILYAIPLFVLAPFLIETVALGKKLPFTDISLPISGFQSDVELMSKMTSLERVGDILLHLALPLICLLYMMVAMQAKLARSAYLEALGQDYVKTARAKGLGMRKILIKHVGKNAILTSVTAVASSFGAILGGSLIVETVFNIHGFGRFFYEAILNRDYNVILFSAIFGSLLTLVGYLAADVAYMLLDPRVKIQE